MPRTTRLLVLAGDEAVDIHLPRHQFGFVRAENSNADIADLADEVVERAQRLFHRRQRIVIMRLAEISEWSSAASGWLRRHDVVWGRVPCAPFVAAVEYFVASTMSVAVAEHGAEHRLGAAYAGMMSACRTG
jgi:hypothetical protein